jgi:hypothetical protein
MHEYELNTIWRIEKPPYRLLNAMADLRTLSLNQRDNLPFILALNPDRNPSKVVPCPKLEHLALHVRFEESFDKSELEDMARKRAWKGAKFKSVKVDGWSKVVPEESQKMEHVCVGCGRISPETKEAATEGTIDWSGMGTFD